MRYLRVSGAELPADLFALSPLAFENLSFVLDGYGTEWYSLFYSLFSMKFIYSEYFEKNYL